MLHTINIDGDTTRFVTQRNEKTRPIDRLAIWLRAKLTEHNLSYRDAGNRSGGLVSYATINNVLNRRVTEADRRTILGLARIFGVSEGLVQDVYDGRDPENALSIRKARSLELPSVVWERLDADAKRCMRSPAAQAEAIFLAYFEIADVNVSPKQLTSNTEIVTDPQPLAVTTTLQKKRKS